MKKVIVRPRAQPAMGRIAIPPKYSRWSDYPSNGLDPQKLARIFRQADDGDVSRQMQLFEEMEEKDPHLFSQLQTRKNAVTGLDYEVVPFGEEARDQEIAAFVSEQIGAIRNFDSVLLELLDAIGKGISISEIIWRYQNGAVAVEEIIPIHQKLLLWDQDDRMKLITKVFEGLLAADFASSGSVKEVRLRDAALRLALTPLNHSFAGATPQEVVRYCCRAAGISSLELSSAVYPQRVYPVINGTALSAIEGINHHWGVSASGYMQDGVYRWGKPPVQTAMMLFEYGKNIVSLTKER
ncbi:Protein of unknown function, partial [Ruminococcaceae bacterium D5]